MGISDFLAAAANICSIPASICAVGAGIVGLFRFIDSRRKLQAAPQPPSPPQQIITNPPNTSPKRWQKKGMMFSLVLAGMLVLASGGAIGIHIYNRHGLPGDVPLPDHVTFYAHISDSESDIWFWTVASPETPDALFTFYQQALLENGWDYFYEAQDYIRACHSEGSDQFEELAVTSGDTVTGRGATVTGPSGGSALSLELTMLSYCE